MKSLKNPPLTQSDASLSEARPDDPVPLRHDVAAFIILGVILVFFDLVRPLSLPDEGRYADVGRWMLASGDFLTPRLNGLPFFHKPPLLYWTEAGLFQLWGVHAWVARLVPTLHALIVCGAVYLYGRRFLNLTTARLASLGLATSLGVLGGAQYINHDLMVATWITVTILAFAASLQREGEAARRLAWLGFAAAALALLSKGLIGIALPGLILLLWLIVTRQLARIAHVPWLSGTLILLAIAGPWFYLLAQRYPDFLHYFFIEQQLTRYLGSGFNNKQAWWFYGAVLPVLSFPWVCFIHIRGNKPAGLMGPTHSLAWIWIGVVLIFFSIPQSKLVGYVFPALPPVAMLAGAGMPTLRLARGRRLLIIAGACVLMGGIAYTVTLPHPGEPLPYGGLALTAVVLWLLTSGRFLARPGPALQELGLLAVSALATLAVISVTVASLTRHDHSAAAVARVIHRHDPAGLNPVLTYGAYPLDLAFYLNRHDQIFMLDDWAEHARSKKDNVPRQLLDGARFDPRAARVLMEKARLPDLARRWPNAWLVVAENQCCDSGVTAYFREHGRYDGFVLLTARAWSAEPE